MFVYLLYLVKLNPNDKYTQPKTPQSSCSVFCASRKGVTGWVGRWCHLQDDSTLLCLLLMVESLDLVVRRSTIPCMELESSHFVGPLFLMYKACLEVTVTLSQKFMNKWVCMT